MEDQNRRKLKKIWGFMQTDDWQTWTNTQPNNTSQHFRTQPKSKSSFISNTQILKNTSLILVRKASIRQQKIKSQNRWIGGKGKQEWCRWSTKTSAFRFGIC